MTMMGVKNYKDFLEGDINNSKVRTYLRTAAVFTLSMKSRIPLDGEWIRFPYYHHVFDDERNGFKRQLDYMKNYGDLIGLDEAVSLLGEKKIGGRYFCVTFDDGFKNCLTNALPILDESDCKAAFFIVTDYMNLDSEKDKELLEAFYAKVSGTTPIDILSWNDCKTMLDAGMTIGSHTLNHDCLKELSQEEIHHSLGESKRVIEEQLHIDCKHISCPFGFPGVHYEEGTVIGIAKKLNYQSLLSTRRGPNYADTSLYAIRRDNIIAAWGDYQLKYFFSKS